MELKRKNVNIMGVQQFLGEGITKKQYIWGITKKEVLGQFSGGLAKK